MVYRKGLALLLAPFLSLFLLPSEVYAHGLGARADLPVPAWLFGWAATLVLVISFMLISSLWHKPRWQRQQQGRRLFKIPTLFESITGAVGLGVLVLLVYAGFAGSQVSTLNILPNFVYVAFWVGLPCLSVLFGDLFYLFNPWRFLARAFAWITAPLTKEVDTKPLAYPKWLGVWPAAITLLGFAWLELVYSGNQRPQLLAFLIVFYSLIQLVGMALYGAETWCRRGEGFGVYLSMLSKLSPFQLRDRTLYLQRPLTAVVEVATPPGIVWLMAVLIGSTVFDGLSEGPLWVDLAPKLQSLFTTLGFSLEGALNVASTVGLFAAVFLIYGIYWIGVYGAARLKPELSFQTVARNLSHTLVPIAFAYMFAHYVSLLLYQGQALGALISDPLGSGRDLFGTSDWAINYGFIGAEGIWYIQVAALVLGHLFAVLLAHDRSLVVFGESKRAVHSQYWMLLVMIALTSLGLWLLSGANQ